VLRNIGSIVLRHSRALRPARAAKLHVAAMAAAPSERRAFAALVEDFERENPGIEVELLQLRGDGHRASARDWLRQGAFDVVSGFGGAELQALATEGLVAPLDGLWAENGLADQFSDPAQATVTVDRRPYGVPFSIAPWQFYYRRSLFRRLGLTPPGNWAEFRRAISVLQGARLTPIALGARDLWPIGAWSDYLNLRLHGAEFHNRLLIGAVAPDDPRIPEIFEFWSELRPAFSADAAALRLDQAAAEVAGGNAGMVLLGGFAAPLFWEEMRDDLATFPFPRMRATVARAEDAPTDILLLSARAANRDAALRFLAYAARPGVQRAFNDPLGRLSPNRTAGHLAHPLVRAQADLLASADDVVQFFNLDMLPHAAPQGLAVLRRFLADGDVRAAVAGLNAAVRLPAVAAAAAAAAAE